MNKAEFLSRLAQELLPRMPDPDVQNTMDFYSESIDDLMDEGLSEEEAVARIGTPEEVAAQILADMPPAGESAGEPGAEPATPKEPDVPKPAAGSGSSTAASVAGFPLRGVLLILAGAAVLALCAVIFALLVAYYATTFAMVVSAAACVIGGVYCAVSVGGSFALALIGAGLVCCALSMLLILGIRVFTKVAWRAAAESAKLLSRILGKREGIA